MASSTMVLPALLTCYHVLFILAAIIDARHRIFPNGLALAMASLALGAVAIEALHGAGDAGLVPWATRFAYAVLPAIAICAGLAAFELAWRRIQSAPGLGMGDIKLLFSLALLDPLMAVASLFLGLTALAAACLISKKPSLPLIPFLASAWALLTLIDLAYR